MERTAWFVVVPAFQGSFVKKIFCLESALIEFASLQRETSLLKSDAAEFRLDRLQSCFLGFIVVAARFRTAEIQDVAVCFTQERKRHTLVLLNELMREAFRTHKNKGHRLVPQPSDATP